jgi:hypothetical protein
MNVGAEHAKAWESTLPLRTYPLGPDDLNPHFRMYEDAIYYPYTLQDNFSTEAREVDHRVLMLENEFLRITFMPDIGGRIYSALDKTTGEELFYRDTSRCAARGSMVGSSGTTARKATR